MEFQCFEIQIKTEADSNEFPHDDIPSAGMFAGYQVLFRVYCICFDTSVILFYFVDQIYIVRLLSGVDVTS